MTDPLVSSREHCVLIVEDEAMIAFDLADALAGFGWQVMGPVGTFDEAMALVDDPVIDVALLDVNLGASRSEGIAQRLHARGVPVVFLTGDGAMADSTTTGSCPILSKPIDYQDLHDALLTAIASRAA